MKKIHTLILGLLLGSGIAAAMGPKRPFTQLHKQADGSTLTVTVRGNGRYITYTSTDGLALLRGDDGQFRYATLSANHQLQPSSVVAHEPANREAAERQFITTKALQQSAATSWLEAQCPQPTYQRLSRATASTADGLGIYRQSGGGVVKSIGAPRIPVIMAAFSDVAFRDSIDSAKLTRFLNEAGYHDESYAKGSVRDYFIAQSDSLFQPTFEVVATVQVAGTRASYGKNASSGSIDTGGTQYIKDAIAKAAATVDFTPYAVNGSVPLVAVIFPGPGEQSSFEDGCENYLWAKFSSGYAIPTNEGGPKVAGYLMGNELLQSYGTGPNDITNAHLDGIGLFSHEFGHALGLPDTYYTGTNSSIASSLLTMDYWDIMDYGQYYYNGYAPPGYHAYERATLGWLDYTVLDDTPQHLDLYPFNRANEGNTAYVLRNPANEKEYLILENRQPDTWYPKNMGSGMLITHIDYDAASWSSNTVNNDPNRQRVAYIPADGTKDGTKITTTLTALFNGYKGDLYPGTTNATSFGADADSASIWQTPGSAAFNTPLYNIELTADGVIKFGYIDSTPTGMASVTAPALDDASMPCYTLQGRRIASLRQAAPGIYILPNGRKVVKH